MDDERDGWKASRKTTTTSFTICNMYRFFPIQDGKEKRRKELVTVHHSFIQEVCERVCIRFFFFFNCEFFQSISLKINDFL